MKITPHDQAKYWAEECIKARKKVKELEQQIDELLNQIAETQ